MWNTSVPDAHTPAGDTATARPGTAPGMPSLATADVAALVLLALPALYLYSPIAGKLLRDWNENPDNSHGFLIPFFVGFLIWTNRERYAGIAKRPSWIGLTIVFLGLLTLLTGIFGADLFLQRTSFVLLCAGVVWTLAGMEMLRATRYPLGVMLLGIPLPTLVLNHITFPLQLLASRVASAMLPLAGVPVLREGNIISLPAMQLEVAEACSGIRSLMSLLTVAIILGYFVERTSLRRLLLALASIPIAVVANSIRIFGTGLCVQYWDPDKAMGFFHEFSGWLVFLVSLTLLYGCHLLMAKLWPEEARQ